MSEPKHVKVDNWGVYFLQRLKHFFNRTDYCDLTLQFQDNAQLKVHRLVLSACTEYFELLERTCEMFEDCLVMPDDLQADVVVPIVNFMYTGQLEFRMEVLERLHATSEIMNMPVLTKLLDAHRAKGRQSQSSVKRAHKQQGQAKPIQAKPIQAKQLQVEVAPMSAAKRSYAKALEVNNVVYRDKKYYTPASKPSTAVILGNGGQTYRAPSPLPLEAVTSLQVQKFVAGEPRPTRYELPEELDSDNMFQNSFCNISYTSQPLMVHPDTTKQYAKRPKLEKGLPSTSKRSKSTILDIVECKKIEKETDDNIFEESTSAVACDETEMFKPSFSNHVSIKTEPVRDPNKLFDQLLVQSKEHAAKVTIETPKNNKAGAYLDHAKIISEVLKKYPHLVKSNKNIKLKIFNNPSTGKTCGRKQKPSPQPAMEKVACIDTGFTYETDVLDSKQAARLIALGAENIEGPWICLICGAPGKALHFTNYYKFRRHLVEVHNEKPVLNICEYCGQRITKRNYLLHHLYTKHGVPPPPSHNFPKCPQCNYIALTEALLVKHKLSHTEAKHFRCNVCPASFNSSNQLLVHIQCTGHKYIQDRKHSHQCIYCLRIFLRENNLYAHLKTHHKVEAVKDGIIDESDDEAQEAQLQPIKNEPGQIECVDTNSSVNMEYHIQQKPDGNIQLIHKKPAETIIPSPSKQKILNSDLTSETPKAPASKSKQAKNVQIIQAEHTQDEHSQEIASPIIQNEEGYILIDNNEYVIRGNQLILRNTKEPSEEFILSDLTEREETEIQPSTSIGYASLLSTNQNIQHVTQNISESIPIFVSNEEEYRALMVSSNENIIFDTTDSNKTLAVLTTPDAATLDNASINLDNTQNNDMVIIQEQYPMNVTESVATDNSNNIVVVYSQQMGESNKEYQLLTTQSLGPQYVQTSTMMTQNYESVSTSSSVTSAHILEPDATWHNVIPQTAGNQHPENNVMVESILQTEVQATHAPELVDENSMIDLPQVDMIPLDQPANNQIEDMSTDQPETTENLPDSESIREAQTTMEVDVPEEASLIEQNYEPTEEISEALVETHDESDNADTLVYADSVIQEDSLEIEQEQVLENGSEVELQPEVADIDSQSPVDTNEEINAEIQPDKALSNVSMDAQHANTNENATSTVINISEENVNTMSIDNQSAEDEIQASIEAVTEITSVEKDQDQLNADNDLCVTEVVEEIQSLASEWTEEDIETPVQDTIEEPSEDNTNAQTKTDELEESIENIEQELKQMLEVTPPAEKIKTVHYEVEPAVDEIETTGENISSSNQSEVDRPSLQVNPQEKISSLLNDWDDNDSQEDVMNENVSNDQSQVIESNIQNPDDGSSDLNPEVENASDDVENEIESPPAIADDHEITEQTIAEPQNVASEMIGKQDNIKSLVSDWDDEEEDENKQQSINH